MFDSVPGGALQWAAFRVAICISAIPLTVYCPGKELSEAVLNNDSTALKGKRYNDLLDHFKYAETELNKTGVTRQVLWLEYKEQHNDGYNYSQ